MHYRFVRAALAATILVAPNLALANSTTTNLGLNKPSVGADADAWGAYLNTNADTLDALFNSSPSLLVAKGGTGATTAAGARTNLSVPGLASANVFTAAQTVQGVAANSLAEVATVQNNTADAASDEVGLDLLPSSTGCSAIFSGYRDGAATSTGLRFWTCNAGSRAAAGSVDHAGNWSIGVSGSTVTLTEHVIMSGTAPSVGSCGTGPSVTAGGSDNRAKVTNGSGTVTSCAVTFHSAFASAPICVVTLLNGGTTVATITGLSTTALTVSFSASYNGSWYFICLG